MRCVIEAVAGEIAHLVVLDQHVGACRSLRTSAWPSGARHVDRDRLLAAVGGGEVAGVARVPALGIPKPGRTPGARVVAHLGPLHLDHLGAEIGEVLRAPRPRQHARQIEYLDVRKCSRHDASPSSLKFQNGTTLPGFMMLSGSSARLTVRIMSSSTGDLVMGELGEAQAADAVLGADRAAELDDDIVHDAIDARPARRRNVCQSAPTGAHRVVVHVAVADVPEGAMANSGIGRRERRIGPRDELGDARDRHRDVVRDAAACRDLRLGEVLAHLPLALRPARRTRRSPRRGPVPLPAPQRARPQRLVQRAWRALPRHVQQHVPGMRARASGRSCPGTPVRRKSMIERADQLEGGELLRPSARFMCPSSATPFSGLSTATHAVSLAVGLREQPQHGRGDDAERALARR